MGRFTQFICIAILALASGCARNSNQTWEDLKTAGRYVHRGVDAMFGKEYESRLLTSDEEFIGPYDNEFIPLRDSDLKSASLGDSALPQPKGIPGQKGVPSLSEFYLPADTLRAYFKSIHFETDEHVLKDKHDLEVLSQMASYLKKKPECISRHRRTLRREGIGKLQYGARYAPRQLRPFISC